MRRLALLAFLPSLAVAQDWRFAHPDATLVGIIRPQTILNSLLVEAAIENAAQKDSSVATTIEMARGFLSGIAEIRFSVLDNGTPEPDVIALISGELDEALVRMIAKDKAKAKRIDANILLLGNGVSLKQAAARMTSRITVQRPRVLTGTESLSENDVWLSGQIPESTMTAMMPDANMKLLRIAFGVRMRDQLQAELDVEAATPTMAQKLIELAVDAQAQQPAEYKDLLRYSTNGATAHFIVDVPQQVALDAAREKLSARPLAPLSPTRRVIVIQGLDEGAREIPLK